MSTDRLTALSPTAIETIEIIGNPGPRYDAEGNAVINIITKANNEQGRGRARSKTTTATAILWGTTTEPTSIITTPVANGRPMPTMVCSWATTGVSSAPVAPVMRPVMTTSFARPSKNEWQYAYDKLF